MIPPEDIAYKLKLLAEEYKEKFKCEVFLSDITPRNDQYHQDVEIRNHNLNSLLTNSHIKRAKHSSIKSQHLRDDKHLKRNRNQGKVMSCVQLFCKTIYETMTQKIIEMEMIKKSLWYLSKMYIIEVYKVGDTKKTVIFNINHNNKVIEGTPTQTISLITFFITIAIISIIRLHHIIIDPADKVVILNDWKVKFKINWDDVFIYKYVGNNYENYVTMDGN